MRSYADQALRSTGIALAGQLKKEKGVTLVGAGSVRGTEVRDDPLVRLLKSDLPFLARISPDVDRQVRLKTALADGCVAQNPTDTRAGSIVRGSHYSRKCENCNRA